MTNFNCKTKNKQTQIEEWGCEIQIWGRGRQIQIGTGGQGQSRRLGNASTRLTIKKPDQRQ